jgi:glutaredoxin
VSRKFIFVAVIAIGAWVGMRAGLFHHHGIESIGASISGDVSEEDLRGLASGVGKEDVVIYTTTECPYCAQAKAWMTQYGFAYTECNTEVSESCADELDKLGGVGVPYLVVRGHQMKDGFDSDEFVAALRDSGTTT